MVGPKRVVPCEDLFQAVDVAFKLVYILNLKFPRETFAVCTFIQTGNFVCAAAGSVSWQK